MSAKRVSRKVSAREEYDHRLTATASGFKVVSKIGPGQFDRHRCSTKRRAFRLASKLANSNGRVYMVYAISADGFTDAHILNFYPE